MTEILTPQELKEQIFALIAVLPHIDEDVATTQTKLFGLVEEYAKRVKEETVLDRAEE